MKKIILWAGALLCGIFLLVGIFFGVKRPDYVKEAWDNLFSNELTLENIAADNDIDAR